LRFYTALVEIRVEITLAVSSDVGLSGLHRIQGNVALHSAGSGPMRCRRDSPASRAFCTAFVEIRVEIVQSLLLGVGFSGLH
jgi:hypothetical protein